MSITVNNLTKNYGSQVAVNNISFTLNKGEIVGFLGPNGAGKSTTMKMITGFIPADGGSISVCGIPAGTENREAKRKIGYLPESNPLYTDMFVREYLYFLAKVHGINNARDVIEEIIKKVDLTPEAHKKINQLSKGYKQRVGLAAALVHDPEVLILDEPTSGLDPNQIVGIRAVIRELAATRTILFSSHIMQEVEALCERAIIINKGNIVADDTLDNLKRGSSGQHDVRVEFRERTDAGIFRNMQDVIQIVPLQSTSVNAGSGWRIITDQPDIVRKQVLQLSVDQKLDIVSLQAGTQNLESVFQALTL
jgi:ABC-2 type transport system ATP-binding protein